MKAGLPPSSTLPEPSLVRSVLFSVCFTLWTIVPAILMAWVVLLPTPAVFFFIRGWQNGLGLIEKYVLGLRYRVIGRENIPDGPCIIAAKHQSAWEACKLHALLYNPSVVLKAELMRVPIWGWFGIAGKMIPVDRSTGGPALKRMMRAAHAAKDAGRPIAIFPQGTRVPIGKHIPYKIGTAALYQELKIPIVPMAVNSGMFWPKGSSLKRAGEITVEFLPPIPADLSRAEVMRRLEAELEEASNRLAQNVGYTGTFEASTRGRKREKSESA